MASGRLQGSPLLKTCFHRRGDGLAEGESKSLQEIRALVRYNLLSPNIGTSPSGKAPGFGPGIRGFESLRPSHFREKIQIFARMGDFLVQIS
ncbi:MAG: hypothetical protein QG629_139 [Patescibacteria group bacterium]|nr:hypothetical protein [Patescibacteria group bacterium]